VTSTQSQRTSLRRAVGRTSSPNAMRRWRYNGLKALDIVVASERDTTTGAACRLVLE